jgi:hypothetical protein
LLLRHSFLSEKGMTLPLHQINDAYDSLLKILFKVLTKSYGPASSLERAKIVTNHKCLQYLVVNIITFDQTANQIGCTNPCYLCEPGAPNLHILAVPWLFLLVKNKIISYPPYCP